jgi:hypothetical protein
VILVRDDDEDPAPGREEDEEVIAEFDHEDGHVRLLLIGSRTVRLEVDGEMYSEHRYPKRFDPDVILATVEYESSFWAEEQQPLQEIDYELDGLEYKLKQWPYSREGR